MSGFNQNDLDWFGLICVCPGIEVKKKKIYDFKIALKPKLMLQYADLQKDWKSGSLEKSRNQLDQPPQH